MVWIFLVMISLLVPFSVSAEDYVCGDATVLTRYQPSVDPTLMPGSVGGKSCSLIGKAQTATQRTLVQSVPAYYLTVVGGLAVEMTQPDKDAVDASRAAEAAARLALLDVVQTDTFCATADLGTIASRLATRKATKQAAIDAIAAANLATLKAGLGALLDEEYFLSEKILMCLFASRRTRQ